MGGVVRRYIDFLIIIITYPYSTCIIYNYIYIALFCSSIPTSLFIFKMFFRSLIYIIITVMYYYNIYVIHIIMILMSNVFCSVNIG